jgi:hypothetical protein
VSRRWVDRLLIAAALGIVALVAASALASHFRSTTRVEAIATTPHPPPLGAEARSDPTSISIVVGQSDIALHASPETTFLRLCRFDRLDIGVRPGPRLVLGYDGPPCHLPELDIQAAVRDVHGRYVRVVDALPPHPFPPNLAGHQTLSTPLLPGLLRCWSGRPLGLRVNLRGTAISGTIRCRGQR